MEILTSKCIFYASYFVEVFCIWQTQSAHPEGMSRLLKDVVSRKNRAESGIAYLEMSLEIFSIVTFSKRH